MSIMSNRRPIAIEPPPGDKLSHQLVALYRTLKGVRNNEAVEFDFSQLTWLYPMLVLPIAAYENTTGSTHKLFPDSMHNYAEVIQYPNGVDSVSKLQQKRSYIPIGVLNRSGGVGREKLESAFSQLIINTIQAVPNSSSAIHYPISELITNIFDHSQSEQGWIFAQWYPTKGFLDLCIVDHGRGLVATYKEELGISLRDEDALRRALRGVSTKKTKERGFGLRTSKDVVCKALGGSFVFLSGSAAIVSDRQTDRIARLPDFSWQGVIVAYRVPKPVGPVDIYSYLE